MSDDWKGMEDLVVSVDSRSPHKIFRLVGDAKFLGGQGQFVARASDVNVKRNFMAFAFPYFGVFKNHRDLDEERTLLFRKDFLFRLKDGGKPQVFLVFPERFEDLPNDLRFHPVWGGVFELVYNAQNDLRVKIEAYKNKQMQDAEFLNFLTSSQKKYREVFQGMFKELVDKAMDEKGVRNPVMPQSQPQQSSSSPGFPRV